MPKAAREASPGAVHEVERIDGKHDKIRNCLQCKAEGNWRALTGKPLKEVDMNRGNRLRGESKWKRASQTRFQYNYCKAPLCKTGPCWEK